MTSINLIADDSGLQKLRIDNESPVATRGVAATMPSPRVEKHPRDYEQVKPIHEQRRHGERRKAERRQRHEPVLLDTRSSRERRKNTGNRKEDTAETKLTPRGINIVT